MGNPYESDNYINPGYLDIQEVANKADTDFLQLRIPADGNCGFYCIAVGLMNLTALNEYFFSKANYQLLARQFHSKNQKEVIDSRREYYDKGTPSPSKRVRIKEISDRLLNIQEALANNRLNTFEQFKYYLLSNKKSFQSILGTTIYLANALRQLSAKALAADKVAAADKDGEMVEFPQLLALARMLDVDLVIYDPELKVLMSSRELDDPAKPAPVRKQIAISFRCDSQGNSGHYNFLIPKAEYNQDPYYLAFPNKFKKPEPLRLFQEKILSEKNKFQALKFKEFRGHVLTLEDEIRKLSAAAEIEVGNELLRVIRTHSHDIFSDRPERKIQALTHCYAALVQAQADFAHSKQRSLCNVLANLGLFILGLGVLYLVAGSIHYMNTGRFTFFNKPSLDKALPQFSQQLLRAAQEAGAPKDPAQAPLSPIPAWSSLKV